MIKCTVGAVVYQGAWQYLEEFFKSIANQKMTGNRAFDLLILNDDCDINELNNLVSGIITDGMYKILDYSSRERKMSPAIFRMELLKQAKNLGKELLVVGDCDDVFTPGRVDACMIAAGDQREYAFYYGDLTLNDGSNVFKALPKTISKEDVIEKLAQGNFLGMGTCAIDMRLLSDEYIESLCDVDVTAYDWYLFTRLVMDIAPGKYVTNAAMIYRLYEGNAAGVVTEYNQKNISREIAFKRSHYAILGKHYIEFKKLSERFEMLYLDGNEDLVFWEKYRGRNDKGLWWNLIEI